MPFHSFSSLHLTVCVFASVGIACVRCVDPLAVRVSTHTVRLPDDAARSLARVHLGVCGHADAVSLRRGGAHGVAGVRRRDGGRADVAAEARYWPRKHHLPLRPVRGVALRLAQQHLWWLVRDQRVDVSRVLRAVPHDAYWLHAVGVRDRLGMRHHRDARPRQDRVPADGMRAARGQPLSTRNWWRVRARGVLGVLGVRALHSLCCTHPAPTLLLLYAPTLCSNSVLLLCSMCWRLRVCVVTLVHAQMDELNFYVSDQRVPEHLSIKLRQYFRNTLYLVRAKRYEALLGKMWRAAIEHRTRACLSAEYIRGKACSPWFASMTTSALGGCRCTQVNAATRRHRVRDGPRAAALSAVPRAS